MNCHDVPDLFRYLFWHLFLMSFGIEFGSVLGAFWHYFQCFSRLIFEWFFDCIFNGKLLPKWTVVTSRGAPFFHTFRDPALYVDFMLDLVAPWLTFGTLGPPSASLLAPIGSLLTNFWHLLAPFWLPLAPFGSLLAPFPRRLWELS